VATKGKKVDVDRLKAKDAAKKQAKGPITEEIVKAHLPMVESIAANIAAGGKLPPGISFNDLVSFGLEGLVKAWGHFDTSRGVQFKTYASYRVRGEILDRLRKEWKYRNPSSYKSQQQKIQDRIAEVARDALSDEENTGISSEEKEHKVQDIIANSAVVYLLSMENIDIQSDVKGTKDPSQEVVDQMEFSRERTVLWEEIQSLSYEEKQIINLFYLEDINQKDISAKLNLSKSKVSRMHVKLLEKLRRRLKRRL
jgi:RNA polymerase sigma factor for flagellar operon FliA